VTIGPVFLVVAISMTSTLKSQHLVQTVLERAVVGEALLALFKVLPFMVMWLLFAGLYLFMPNVKVSPRAALIGGIFGGTLWQISQWGYLNFQVGVARYNAIYGTMAALPILMVWIYLSWMIVLLGLELTYATQNLRSIRQDIRGVRLNFASRELIALTVLLFIGRRFYLGKPALGQEELASQMDVPSRLMHTTLDELARLGFVTAIAHNDAVGYQPARELEKIPLFEVLRGLAVDGTEYNPQRKTHECSVVTGVTALLQEAEQRALAGMSLRDLVLQAEEAVEQGESGD